MRLPTFRDRNRRQSQFGSLLDTFFQDLESDFFGGGFGHLGNTDIYEKDGNLHYETEMPGLKKEDIKIRVSGDELIVTGEVQEQKEEKNANFLRRGRRYGRFRRTFPLPEEVEDPEKIKAKFEDGILHIQAPLSKPIGEEGAIDVEIE